jgi:hypothetical protein
METTEKTNRFFLLTTLITTALITVLTLTSLSACDNDDDSSGCQGTEAPVDFSTAKIYTGVINSMGNAYTETVTFTHSYWNGNPYDLPIDSTVSISNGTLTLKLGTPPSSSFWDLVWDLGYVTVKPTNLKLYIVDGFRVYNGHYYKSISWEDDNDAEVLLIYANKDGSITTYSLHYPYGFTDIKLKQGWNTVIRSSSGNYSAVPDSSFKWVVYGQ